MTMPYDVLVLAGGAARRLGGLDKPAQLVGNRSLLDRVLQAAAGAARVVVVGPRRVVTAAHVRWTQEQPPGAGPVAALQAGLAQVSAPVVVLLAADLPFLPAALIAALAGEVSTGAGDVEARVSGSVLVDDDGRPQWLLSAWPTEALRRALLGSAPNASLRSVLDDLTWRALPRSNDPDQSQPPAQPWQDCDTFEELAQARRTDQRHHDHPFNTAHLDA